MHYLSDKLMQIMFQNIEMILWILFFRGRLLWFFVIGRVTQRNRQLQTCTKQIKKKKKKTPTIFKEATENYFSSCCIVSSFTTSIHHIREKSKNDVGEHSTEGKLNLLLTEVLTGSC